MCDVQGERDSRNQAAASLAPAVMPAELVKMTPRIFVAEMLDPRRAHIAKFWSTEQVEEIESDHRSLCREYIVNKRVKTNKIMRLCLTVAGITSRAA